MRTYTTIALASLAFTALAQPAFAQTSSAADPACIVKNADGSETVDKIKCPDGLKPAAPGAASETAPATDSTATQSTTTAPEAVTPDQEAAPDSTASTTPVPSLSNDVIVPADRFANARVMTASDFIGKRVYTKSGEDIGEVNDLIVTDNGAVQAVILGVGGFLGLGEKDVAVTMQSIEMQTDGSSSKLVVDASKEQLTNAPGYDREKRTYLN
jgi:sporulation protein YlmC with PRC-barrel domain